MRTFSLLIVTTLALVACQPASNDGTSTSSISVADEQRIAEAYIRANIATLSPEPAVMGGTLQVTDIAWTEHKRAVITYEDGHNQFIADANVNVNGGEKVVVTSFKIRPPEPVGAKEGEFCGGIAGFQCASGLTCKYDGNYPDAGGLCTKAAGTSMEMNHESMTMGMDEMSAALEGKTGDAFDRTFLELMIPHHQGAIDMAMAAKESAKHPELKRMADEIIAAQKAEIAQMQKWQQAWGYTE
jgi:hypothetical protein